MANIERHPEMESEGIITLQSLEAAAEAMLHRGNIRKGGLKSWISELIERWDEQFPAQGEEFRIDESVREQHSLASQHEHNWRVPYGMDSLEARALVAEIERRRRYGISLVGLTWPPSDDPYAPANNPNHPYYLPVEAES
jgi:hypothetical protein